MKLALATLAANLVSISCVITAGALALHEKDGWGWFLFIGLCCTGSVNLKTKEETKHDTERTD